ncbi:MAG: hypothetical protein M3N08_08465 [Pseudomonadota bacterium]|nr:hypothetical protein [Pseudomonadota bacterium]
MNVDWNQLSKVRALQPDMVKGHIDKLESHKGPGFIAQAGRIAVNWGVTAAAETFMAVTLIPLIPVAGVGAAAEVAAPFLAKQIGNGAEWLAYDSFGRKEKRNNPDRPTPATTAALTPALAAS